MDEVLIKDIRHEYVENERLCEWKNIVLNGDMRLFYQRLDEERSGFYFYCIERTSYGLDEWGGETDTGHCVFNGIAYFDGIRHLYYGDAQTDNFGYHYYPSLENLIVALAALRDLEKAYCDYLYS